jgi:hypothetical protein
LSGRILNQETGQPIARAQVRVGSETTTTDAEGRYTLTGLPPGQYILSVTHEGYDPGLSAIFTLAAEQELAVDLPLFAPNTSPYPQDPMLTNPLDPNGAPTQADAERLVREQGLTGEVVSIKETKLRGEFLVNYKRNNNVRAAVAELNHDTWELTDDTGRKWWIIKVCGNLASPLPKEAPIATPIPRPLPPLAEVLVDGLVVRSCAAEGCAEVGTVPRGTQVEVFGCLAKGGDWCEVGWSGGQGWCTGKSLQQLAVAKAVPMVERVLPTATPGVTASGEEKIAFVCTMQDCHKDENGNCLKAKDGTVLLKSNDEICVINPDGSGLTRLTNDPAQDWYPAWSPDRQQIIFTSGGRDGDWSSFDLYIMDADGSNVKRLTTLPDSAWDPAWSPDGQQIAFSGDGGIYVMNADGSGLTHLADGASLSPTWSSDGQHIAFPGIGGIYVMNADGSGQARIADQGAFLAWSPDGRKIAFVSERDGNAEIYVMNTDGSGMTRLTNHPAQDEYPTWSPDGQKIAFTSNRDNSEWGIYIMNIDGSDQTQLIDIDYSIGSPSWAH